LEEPLNELAGLWPGEVVALPLVARGRRLLGHLLGRLDPWPVTAPEA
jgi:hypothetical protein